MFRLGGMRAGDTRGFSIPGWRANVLNPAGVSQLAWGLVEL